jgi:hypothetical protein
MLLLMLILLVAALLDLRAGFGRLLLPEAPQAAISYHGPECRPDPHANVYLGLRLILIRPCVKVEGVVYTAERAPDGDLHIGLYLQPGDLAVIDEHNVLDRGGRLVVEAVPADQAGCTPGKPPPASDQPAGRLGICTGANVAAPASGDRIAVIGAYVIDAQYGWTEVHPAWSLTVLAHHQPMPPPPTSAQRLPPWFDWVLHTAQTAQVRFHSSPSRLVRLLRRLAH